MKARNGVMVKFKLLLKGYVFYFQIFIEFVERGRRRRPPVLLSTYIKRNVVSVCLFGVYVFANSSLVSNDRFFCGDSEKYWSYASEKTLWG